MNAQIGLAQLIRTLVYGLHDGQSSAQASGHGEHPDYTHGLHLSFNITARLEGKSNSACVSFLFVRPWGSKGFATTYTFARVNGKEAWEFLSGHDSEWGVREYLWKVEQSLQVDPEVALAQHNWHTSFTWGDRAHRWVAVKVEKDLTDERGYRKTVKEL